MSLNIAISQEYLVQTQALLALLEQYMSRWRGASTLEDQLLIEADAVATFQRLLDLQLYMNYVSPGEHPDLNEIGRVYSDWDFLLRLNSAKIQKLAEEFLTKFNSQKMALMELTSMMKRIRQKKASLALWTRDKAKYVLAEHFLNFDALDSRFTSLPECDVDTNQGVLTLPIRNKSLLTPKTARIGASSNGVPGNSDAEVQTNNANPVFAINGDNTNWFEYERLDVGPLDLDYVVEFSQPQIINSISIEPVNLGLSLAYEVLDITFSSSGTTETSIKDLVSGAFDLDFFTVKSAGNDSTWAISFLPVQASVVTIRLRQRKSYSIRLATNDDRIAERQRFVIAIKDIAFYRTQYEREGGINSKVLDLPGGLYATIPFADVWPQNTSFFTEHLEVSYDGGSTWQASSIPLTASTVPSTVLMNGTETSFLWRVSLERNSEAFANLTSFIEESNPIAEVSSIQRVVSRFRSPAEIALPETPKDGRVFVMQPKLARRGNKYRGIYLGTGGGKETSFELPFSVIDLGLRPESLRIFVARREYNRVEDSSLVGISEWAFSDDYREIVFGSSLPANSDVRIVFDEELLSIEERSDGYYHRMKLLFDPEKENISVSRLPRNSQRATIILPRGEKVISLGYKNVLDNSFVLTSTNGVAYTEVTTKAEVLDTVDKDYYIDYVNGVLYLADYLDSDIVKATFLHQTEVALSKDQFEVIIENNVPWGIRINKDAFVSQRKVETVGSAIGSTVNILRGTYSPRTNKLASSTNAKTLTYDCVVKGTLTVTDDLVNTDLPPEEVSFQDGHSEFLGLIPMNTEETVAIEAGVNSWVTFNLSAGSLWYSAMDVVFGDATVFANKVSSSDLVKTGGAGDYHVSTAGLVTVNIGVGGILNAGISINYYYRDAAFDPINKYSVDYDNGILYTYSSMNSNASIDYQAACYKVAYDISKEVDTYVYEPSTNAVSIRTEGLFESNNLVKVIWTKAPVTSDLLTLKEFFTPLISVLAFRFN